MPDTTDMIEDNQLGPPRKHTAHFSQMPPERDNHALFLRGTLLRIQGHWPDSPHVQDISTECPFRLEGDELLKHQQDGRRYNELQHLLETELVPVANVCWVPAELLSDRRERLEGAMEQAIRSFGADSEQLERELRSRLAGWNVSD